MPYFAFDVETTGLVPGYHEIIQLSAIMLNDKLEERGSGHMKLMPRYWNRAEKQALEINQINPETWKPSHKSNQESIKKMYDFIYKHADPQDYINCLGHNLLSFDIPFLKDLIAKEGMSWIFHWYHIDTIIWATLYQKVTGEKFNLRLVDCCEYFNIKIDPHRASSDIKATVTLARVFRDNLKSLIKNGGKSLL